MSRLLSGAEIKELQLNSMGENHRYSSQGGMEGIYPVIFDQGRDGRFMVYGLLRIL